MCRDFGLFLAKLAVVLVALWFMGPGLAERIGLRYSAGAFITKAYVAKNIHVLAERYGVPAK
jgi:hypothetical protein